jgi:hypothetical protein
LEIISSHPPEEVTNNSISFNNQGDLIPKVSSKILISPNEPIDLLYKLTSSKWNPLFLRFMASAATLSGSQVGNTCPFPALKAGLSPFCSPRWVPHCSQQIFAQEQWIPLKSEETRGSYSGLWELTLK